MGNFKYNLGDMVSVRDSSLVGHIGKIVARGLIFRGEIRYLIDFPKLDCDCDFAFMERHCYDIEQLSGANLGYYAAESDVFIGSSISTNNKLEPKVINEDDGGLDLL
jgi:hypothetical protein